MHTYCTFSFLAILSPTFSSPLSLMKGKPNLFFVMHEFSNHSNLSNTIVFILLQERCGVYWPRHIQVRMHILQMCLRFYHEYKNGLLYLFFSSNFELYYSYLCDFICHRLYIPSNYMKYLVYHCVYHYVKQTNTQDTVK